MSDIERQTTQAPERRSKGMFSTCLIVASNFKQADSLRELVARRIEGGLYPREIDFVVVSDPEGGRIGSGGATVAALFAINDRLERGESVLMIHAGGESRRMPTYAAEGKLFAPVSVPSSSILPPVILDLQLSLFLKYPWNSCELVVSSGDVVIDFDTEVLPSERGDVYGYAKADTFDLGSHHGVFKFDRNRTHVVDFFQKQRPDFLRENAALEGSRACALDLGIIGFSRRGIECLLELGRAELPNGRRVIEALGTGDLRFDLYLELLIGCLGGLTLDDYRCKLAGQSALDEATLAVIHHSLSKVRLRASVTKRARFLHFGSLEEYPQSSLTLALDGPAPFYVRDEAELGPSISAAAVQVNSIDTRCETERGSSGVFLESCARTRIGRAGGDNLFVGLTDRSFSFPIPAGICLDERQIDGGRVLLVYGARDSWRLADSLSKVVFCGSPLDRWLAERALLAEELFRPVPAGEAHLYDLYEAVLYPLDPDEQLIRGYWDASGVAEEWRERFRNGRRFTLREVLEATSATTRDSLRRGIRSALLRDEILSGRGWLSIPEVDFRTLFTHADRPRLVDLCEASDDDLLRLYRRKLVAGLEPERPQRDPVESLRVDFFAGAATSSRLRREVKLDQIVWARAPVRLDLAGGWTDTPPYTLREGGEVVNLAVNLNGQPPVQVFCRATEEPVIRFHSIDTGAMETVLDFRGLEAYSDPGSSFALPKAALCLVGLTAEGSGVATLAEAVKRIGCGLELSLLAATPKGSGLGTSSILAATILAALERFFGIDVDRSKLSRQVLQIEQMLTTGGGWQDQIGGITGGVKFIESLPGLKPSPIVYQLDPYLFDRTESRERFTLFYTGITRLAKNILQDVVERVNGMEPAYLITLRHLKHLARRAREAISLRDLASLGVVVGESWAANKRIHPSTTNEDVEALLAKLAGLYDGMKLLGAGGGGYILFLSESFEQAEQLRGRLATMEDDRARLVDFTLNPTGLEVSVS